MEWYTTASRISHSTNVTSSLRKMIIHNNCSIGLYQYNWYRFGSEQYVEQVNCKNWNFTKCNNSICKSMIYHGIHLLNLFYKAYQNINLIKSVNHFIIPRNFVSLRISCKLTVLYPPFYYCTITVILTILRILSWVYKWW